MKKLSYLFDGIVINHRNLLINFFGISINWFHALSWIFFIWEVFLLENKFSIFLLSGMFMGVSISMLLWGYLIKKTGKIFEFYFFNILNGVTLITFYIVSPIAEIIIIGSLFLMGFFSSAAIIAGIKYFTITTNVEERGRVAGLLISLGFVVMLSFLLMTISFQIQYVIILGAIIYIITGIIGLICKKKIEVKKELVNLDAYQTFDMKDYFLFYIPLLIMGIIGGVGIFYSLLEPILSFNIVNLGNKLIPIFPIKYSIEFIMLIFSTLGIIFGIILGSIGDFFGRKKIWLFSMITGSIGAYVLGIYQNEFTIFMMILFFALLLTSTSICVLITYGDLTAKTLRGDVYLGLIVGFGILGGIMMGAVIGSLILFSPVIYFSLTIMMIIILGYGALFLVKETLPPKSELKWFKSLNHIYVIKSDSGIILFDFPFVTILEQSVQADLIGGGLTGISTLVKEMTSSQTQLKNIKQEKANILLEYGNYVTSALIATEELKILHKKLEFFTREFETFFKDFLIKWDSNIEHFKPTEVIVERVFELKKFSRIK